MTYKQNKYGGTDLSHTGTQIMAPKIIFIKFSLKKKWLLAFDHHLSEHFEEVHKQKHLGAIFSEGKAPALIFVNFSP